MLIFKNMSMSSEQTIPSEKTVSERASDLIRILSASMVERAQSGHPGGPMGGADFMHILFTEFMVFNHVSYVICPNGSFRILYS